MRLRLPFFTVASRASLYKRFDGDGDGDGAGSGGKTGVSVDEVKTLFKEDLLPQIHTSINNAVANLKKTDVPKLIEGAINPLSDQMKSLQDSIGNLGSGGSGDGGSGGTGDMSPEMKAKFNTAIRTSESLQERLTTLESQKQDADKKLERSERDQVLTTVLSGFSFQDEVAAGSAFKLLRPDVKRLDDGTIVAGDNLPVVDYVKDVLPTRYAFLLKPKESSGAGANGGAPNTGGGKQVTMEDIKPGMSPEERARVSRGILAQLPS